MNLLLYYITDRAQFPGDASHQRRLLLQTVAEAARCGVDYIQLREKDLSPRELEQLAGQAIREIRKLVSVRGGEVSTALLVNSRSDVALSVGADGVHLRADDISPVQAREIFSTHVRSARPEARAWVVGVSCHSAADVAAAAAASADFAVFAPVFEKKGGFSTHPAGLSALREACRQSIPVMALGGVTLENARACVEAGAAGIAGIRLFQEHDIAETVRVLRG